MRIRDFIKKIPKDGWFLGHDGEIRNMASFCDSHAGSWNAEVCPITSVANSKPNRKMWYYMHSYEQAGKGLGLSESQCDTIANAADNILTDSTTQNVRKQLLKHCGLTE